MQAKRNEIRDEPEDCNKTTTQIWKSYMEVKIKKQKQKIGLQLCILFVRYTQIPHSRKYLYSL